MTRRSPWPRRRRSSGNSPRSSANERPVKKSKKLISFQLLSLMELVTTLLLVIVGVEWYYLKEPTPKIRRDLERMDYASSRHPEFRYKTEFQSHEPKFDYLKRLEIEEKINKIRWCQTANGALFLLSTNETKLLRDKTIKFWKVQQKKVKKISEMNIDPSKAVGNGGVPSSSVSSSS